MMVMRPLSARGEQLYQKAASRLAEQLPVLLSEPLADLEAELVARLLAACRIDGPDEGAWDDARSFAATRRDYGNCLAALSRCLLFALSQPLVPLSGEQQALAVAKVLQRQPWPQLVKRHGLAGRKEAVAQLRELFALICSHYS
jgi:tRNA(Met) C34 N-acetyltransferase TmcA